jgi:hypothetical protein
MQLNAVLTVVAEILATIALTFGSIMVTLAELGGVSI